MRRDSYSIPFRWIFEWGIVAEVVANSETDIKAHILGLTGSVTAAVARKVIVILSGVTSSSGNQVNWNYLPMVGVGGFFQSFLDTLWIARKLRSMRFGSRIHFFTEPKRIVPKLVESAREIPEASLNSTSVYLHNSLSSPTLCRSTQEIDDPKWSSAPKNWPMEGGAPWNILSSPLKGRPLESMGSLFPRKTTNFTESTKLI